MSPELEQLIRENFSLLFRKVRRAGGGQAPIGVRGIECGDGWYNLLEALFELLMHPYTQVEDYGEAANSKESSAALERARERERLPAVLQIKEELGTLRVYVHRGNRRAQECIGFAEHYSRRICEQCGAPAALRKDNWLRVRCNPCESIQHVDK